MEEDKQKQAMKPQGPFDILYNYRHRKSAPQRPRRKISVCEKVRPVPQFTMRTRKMTADLDPRGDFSQEAYDQYDNRDELCPQASMNVEEQREFFFKNESELQNGIPLSPEMSNDIGGNLADNSKISNYDKLEQALFGFKLEGCMESQ